MAKADLLVDMAELTFADASFMVDLAMVARRVRKRGSCMVVSGAQPHVARLIEMVGLHRLPNVTIQSPAPALT